MVRVSVSAGLRVRKRLRSVQSSNDSVLVGAADVIQL